VLVPLKARNVRDATTQLAKALIAAGAVADERRLLEILKAEWPEDIVAVRDRAFLPHFRTDAVRELAVALGVAPEPLCLSTDPHRCARVVVLVVAPTAEASAYLRAMSAVAQALAADEVLDGLHRAAGPAEVLALPALAAVPVPDDLTVGDLMTPHVVAVGHDMTLREAAQIMTGRDVSTVPVTGPSREVVGMLTDAHLMRHLLPLTVSQLSTGRVRAVRRRGPKGPPVEPGAVLVREVMDRSVLCLGEDQTLADVAALMLSKEVGRFPVTRDGALVGFLTTGDIVRKLLSK
jgi:CBS domain-containing protein/mannitol/fructose-specific phosphotransferase system IIA component (Ntr-type)